MHAVGRQSRGQVFGDMEASQGLGRHSWTTKTDTKHAHASLKNLYLCLIMLLNLETMTEMHDTCFYLGSQIPAVKKQMHYQKYS